MTKPIDPAEKNIQAVVKLEREALRQRSFGERISDAITKFIGSMTCVALHLSMFAFWFLANLNIIPGVPVFDPFPFGILTLIVSAEGVMLGIFILISQNRMARQSDKRDHLDLQINLLAEQEMTNMLRLLQRVARRLGLEEADDQDIHKLADETDVKTIIRELEQRLPSD